jgi:hypothetical protein
MKSVADVACFDFSVSLKRAKLLFHHTFLNDNPNSSEAAITTTPIRTDRNFAAATSTNE